MDDDALRVDPERAELMLRSWPDASLANSLVVAGCGGGGDIASHLVDVLNQSERLALDAEALNAIALSFAFQVLLRRGRRQEPD